MTLRAFYAWQSDRDERVCHYLIRDAAEDAIGRLKASAEIEEAPVLDHDTKDVPGTPHVADTIRHKIRDCHIFIGDMTFVAAYTSADGRAKKASNANVMLELGMAFESVGFQRTVLVMNTAFGGPEDLPFDLRHHRFPIRYELGNPSRKGEVKAARKELAGRIEAALSAILTSGIIEEAGAEKSMKVTITCRHGEEEKQRHIRWLVADVVNTRDDLNDVFVTLDYQGPDGKLIQSQMQSVGDTPNPFSKGFTCRFAIYNDDPSKLLEPLANVPTGQIAVVIHSRVREVARIPATRWVKELEAFRQPDPAMPPKPPPPSSRQGDYHDYITRYRNRY